METQLARYRSKSDTELRFIIKDASEAAEAVRDYDAKAEAKYLDQVNDATTVLGNRARFNTSKASRRGSLNRAIEFIAYNDNDALDSDEHLQDIAGSLTVALVASVYGEHEIDIASRVLVLRKERAVTVNRQHERGAR